MVSQEGIEKALEDVETLKKELAELKTDHVAVVKQLRQQLLDLQRLVAGSKVNADTVNFCDIMDTQLSKKAGYSTMRTQIITDAAVVKQKIMTSSSPLNLLNDFYQKWTKRLLDLGADMVTY